jgi:hypothetical protein
MWLATGWTTPVRFPAEAEFFISATTSRAWGYLYRALSPGGKAAGAWILLLNPNKCRGLECVGPATSKFKSTVNSGNACCHSVQNLLSLSFVSENLKIKMYKNYNLTCCFILVWYFGVVITLWEEHRLRVFENWVLRRIFGHKRERERERK